MADLPRSQQAGILCNDTRFRRFVASRLCVVSPNWPQQSTVSPTAAAEWLRRQCDIPSRRKLDSDTEAASRFDALKTDFDAYTGKIPSPR